MLWRGATSAWLHVGAVATNAILKPATATVLQALLRMLYAVLLYAAMLFFGVTASNNCVLGFKRSNWICDSTAQPPCSLLRVLPSGAARLRLARLRCSTASVCPSRGHTARTHTRLNSFDLSLLLASVLHPLAPLFGLRRRLGVLACINRALADFAHIRSRSNESQRQTRSSQPTLDERSQV